MDIMSFIFWFIAFGNSLFAQGYTYDVRTNQFIPPAVASAPVPSQPVAHGEANRRNRNQCP